LGVQKRKFIKNERRESKKKRKKGGCRFSSHRCLEPLSVSHATTSHHQLNYQSPFIPGNTLLFLLVFMVCLLACRTCTVHVSTSRNIINWLLCGCFGLDHQPSPRGWAESSKKSERSLFCFWASPGPISFWVSPGRVSLWARCGLVSFWAGLGPFPSRLDSA